MSKEIGERICRDVKISQHPNDRFESQNRYEIEKTFLLFLLDDNQKFDYFYLFKNKMVKQVFASFCIDPNISIIEECKKRNNM